MSEDFSDLILAEVQDALPGHNVAFSRTFEGGEEGAAEKIALVVDGTVSNVTFTPSSVSTMVDYYGIETITGIAKGLVSQLNKPQLAF